MDTNVSSFFTKVSSDPELQRAVATSVDPNAISQLAATRGFAISPEEVRAAIGEDLDAETVHAAALCAAYISAISVVGNEGKKKRRGTAK
jgi:predicted ribosomally synthesized peptide with nif11-like leader